MVGKSITVAVFLLGVAWAQLNSEETQVVDNALGNLPPELQGSVNKEQVEDIKNRTATAFKEKCEANGGPDAFTNAENALKTLKSCMEALVDQNVLKNEIEEAKPKGNIEEVFKKYCDKKPQFKDCFRGAVEASRPCFSNEEQRNLKIVYNVTEQLAEFVCFKDGDRIALFIAEGGVECFEAKRDDIQKCVNETLGSNVQLDANISADSIPEIKFTNKECGQLSKLQTCVVGRLEDCAQPTTANIVESLFKFIRKVTPCKDFPEELPSPRNDKVEAGDKTKSKPDSASGLAVTSVTVVTAALTTLIV